MVGDDALTPMGYVGAASRDARRHRRGCSARCALGGFIMGNMTSAPRRLSWGLFAALFLATVMAAGLFVSAAATEPQDAASALCRYKDDLRKSREELDADRIEIEICRRKLKNDLACLREKLEVDKDARVRAIVARLAESLQNDLRAVNAALEAAEQTPDPTIEADEQAILDARRADQAIVQAAIDRLKADEAKWRKTLNADKQAWLALRKKGK
jgi:hypothetical protein